MNELSLGLSENDYTRFTNAKVSILVPCYSQVRGDVSAETFNPDDIEHWVLNEFQRKNPMQEFNLLQWQVEMGWRLLEQMPWANLIYSGGFVRTEAGRNSEGWSYCTAAIKMLDEELRMRLYSNIGFRDQSYDTTQNVLEALLDFPDVLIAWQYDFKARRMWEIARALGIGNRFVCIGGVDPILNSDDYQRENGVVDWVRRDPRGMQDGNPEGAKMLKRRGENSCVLGEFDRVRYVYRGREFDSYDCLEPFFDQLILRMRSLGPLFENLNVSVAPWLPAPELRRL